MRTDGLFDLNADGAAALVDYGVRTVIDLRYPEERAERPNYFEVTGHPDVQFLPISLSGLPDDHDYELMHHVGNLLLWNQRQLEHGRRHIASVLRAVIAAPPGGVLFHCHSGKDRTGIIAQLLLLLAGVDEESVIADYMVTNERLASRNARILDSIDDPAQRAFVASLCFVQLENVHYNLGLYRDVGGAEAFLTLCGLTHGEIAALRARVMGDIA